MRLKLGSKPLAKNIRSIAIEGFKRANKSISVESADLWDEYFEIGEYFEVIIYYNNDQHKHCYGKITFENGKYYADLKYTDEH